MDDTDCIIFTRLRLIPPLDLLPSALPQLTFVQRFNSLIRKYNVLKHNFHIFYLNYPKYLATLYPSIYSIASDKRITAIVLLASGYLQYSFESIN